MLNKNENLGVTYLLKSKSGVTGNRKSILFGLKSLPLEAFGIRPHIYIMYWFSTIVWEKLMLKANLNFQILLKGKFFLQ